MTDQLPADLLETFLDSAARGHLNQVRSLLTQVPSLLDRTGTGGWTALMLAARHGHRDVAETLLSQGCNRFSVNSSSQTAHDIATFWGHRHVSDLLGRPDLDHQQTSSTGETPSTRKTSSTMETYFSMETLDRLSRRRTDPGWLETKRTDPNTVYLLFSNLSPMVVQQENHSTLCRFTYEAVKHLLHQPATLLIFLGVERRKTSSSSSSCSSSSSSSSSSCVGVWEPPAWFAISTDEDAADLVKLCREKSCSFPTFPTRDLLKLSEEEAGVVAQARSVLAWHSRYSFCSTCGSSTECQEAGYKRSCLNTSCCSRKGVHNTCYPRVDPVVIMLVIHPDGNQCLLGRKKTFPVGMFSCLAGFIEPGETLEAAVRRETEEESGVQVGAVQYVTCQPWPMPSSLMIGCLAVAMTTDIRVDKNEIEEARWFPWQQVLESLSRGSGSTFSVPPPQTIAHQLIRHWLSIKSNL